MIICYIECNLLGQLLEVFLNKLQKLCCSMGAIGIFGVSDANIPLTKIRVDGDGAQGGCAIFGNTSEAANPHRGGIEGRTKAKLYHTA